MSVTVCGSGWPWGHDVMLARVQSWRMAEGRDSSTSVELTPRRREDAGNQDGRGVFQLARLGCMKRSKGARGSKRATPVQSTARELGKTGKEMLNWRGESNAKELEENAILGTITAAPTLRHCSKACQYTVLSSRSIRFQHTGARWVTSPQWALPWPLL